MVKEFQVIEIEQEHFEPKSPFKSNDLKGLVNLSRVNWTNVYRAVQSPWGGDFKNETPQNYH
jgi:hypothetical protein